jgi:hypothetical protein
MNNVFSSRRRGPEAALLGCPLVGPFAAGAYAQTTSCRTGPTVALSNGKSITLNSST